MDRRLFLQTLAVVSGGTALKRFDSHRRTSAPRPTLPVPGVAPPPGYQLPMWFDQARVQAHTRLPLDLLERDIFLDAAQIRSLGARVLCRHIKSGDEGAWWPSAVGAIVPEAMDRNLALEIIENAHSAGCRILVYYRHQEDAYMAEHNQDWICRGPGDRPLRTRRGQYLCLNSPYCAYVLTRLRELAAMGADGFFFDESHMPPVGCWCRYCRERFRSEVGQDLPKRRNPKDSVYQAQLDFNNRTVERALEAWRTALHADHPHLVLIVSAYRWVTTAGRHLTSNLMRISDCVKTEFDLPTAVSRHSPFERRKRVRSRERDVQLALGYTMARDAADGRPPLVWIHGRLSEEALLRATSGVLAHGGVASIDIPEAMPSNPIYRAPFALGDRVMPELAGSRPLRWAAVHFPERARNKLYAEPEEAWDSVLDPFYEAFEALLRARVPVGVVTDNQLEEGRLEDYNVLALPVPDLPSSDVRGSIERFRASGGVVVGRSASWIHQLQHLARHAPIRAVGGPDRLHAVPFVKPGTEKLVIALVNDFSSIRTGRDYRPYVGWARVIEKSRVPTARNVRVEVRGLAIAERSFDAVTGTSLAISQTDWGHEIEVPSIDRLALVVLTRR